MKMIIIFFVLILKHLVYSEDICKSVNCGPGFCKTTQNPTLPYYCQCPNGSNTILPCPSENPCSRNPCGQGSCEVVPKLLYGYLCRCAGDTISLTSCNVTHNSCASNPCTNGICIEGLTSFVCNCLPTWTGRNCRENIGSSCLNNLCGAGKCFPVNDPALPYICLCPNAQFGMSCPGMKYLSTTPRMLITTTRALDVCNPLNRENCMNGGQCLPTVNGYQCLCTSGFTGRLCEMKTNECASNPCLYGGVCYDLQSSYICACSDGSFRSQCLPKAVMTSTARTLICPCQNGGVCAMFGSQMCTCPKGFTGPFCENSLSMNGCQQIQCTNGGTCHENSPDSVSAYCLCKNGYTGKFCEIEYFQCQGNGRFMDQYNCEKGKYFECIHHVPGGGVLLSRSCPATLRFNFFIDGCDYPKNVQCIPN